MNIFNVASGKLNATYLRGKGFDRHYWGSPREWARDKIFYEGIEIVDCSHDSDAITDEADWVVDWFPGTFLGKVYILNKFVDMRNRCMAQYGSRTIISDVMKTISDYEVFIESLKNKCGILYDQ